jgi:iron(III) transport system substrate-binding protein
MNTTSDKSLNRRRLLAFAAAGLSAIGLADCGGRPANTRSSSAEAAEPAVPELTQKVGTVEKIKEVPDKVLETDQTLTLYSGRSEKLVAPILDTFEKATGINVQVKYGKTPALAATILEEGKKSPADVFYAQDPGGLGSVEAHLSKLPSELLRRVPAWAQHPDGLWVGVTGRARTIIYNTRSLSEGDLPNDMWGFTDAAWKNHIGWAPTNGSFQTMVTGMRALWGEGKTKEWLLEIKANEPTEYPANTPQVAAAGAGEIDVGFVNHYYLHRALAEKGENFPARNYHVRSGGAGALVMVSGASILKTARNPGPSAKLLAYLLADATQESFASTTYEYPLVPGAAQHPDIAPLASLKHPSIAAADLADLKGTQELLRKAAILP